MLLMGFVPDGGELFVEVVVLTPDADGGSACISCSAVLRHLISFAACPLKRSFYSGGPLIGCTFIKGLSAKGYMLSMDRKLPSIVVVSKRALCVLKLMCRGIFLISSLILHHFPCASSDFTDGIAPLRPLSPPPCRISFISHQLLSLEEASASHHSPRLSTPSISDYQSQRGKKEPTSESISSTLA
ncbi:hypothetical protein TIFTF001_034408 [Ficus carica]|uniref:Uncharacterized protein n=1 Tax=Ficus carica TaxID=3494 RepID=A0AA88E0D4_FICCA|nr:hypothetical protein TIFTF001_034408 [Ficus carica]